jgi:3-hydroxyisobutyrate dehydrogenase
MARIAFLGLGKMGFAMASRVIAAGHDVTVYNRTASRAEPLVRLGARRAATPQEASHGVHAVIAMTADDVASRAVWFGPDGALAADLKPETFAIECSTLSHDWVLELAHRARTRKLRYIDAPVTGLPAAAAAGALTLLVGASAEDLASARPLLDAFSERIIHFGPVGSGTIYKLMINMIGAVQIASAAEGMALAEGAGLDLSQVADAIAQGQAASPQVVRNVRRMAENNHDRDVVFTPALRLKDVQYALQLAQKLGVGSAFGELAASLLRKLCERGAGQANESKIIEVVRNPSP